MKYILVLSLIFSSFLTGALVSAQERSIKRAKLINDTARTTATVRAVIDSQQDAWNRGDIEEFMKGYNRSADTVFVSGDSVTHGWDTVLEHYRKTYNSRDKMGTLTFSELEITAIGSTAAIVLGRWHLQRANDQPHGTFSLVFRRFKQGWKIIHDHTSSAP
jgi:uncharacterized protein (TIGR02246 family)